MLSVDVVESVVTTADSIAMVVVELVVVEVVDVVKGELVFAAVLLSVS